MRVAITERQILSPLGFGVRGHLDGLFNRRDTGHQTKLGPWLLPPDLHLELQDFANAHRIKKFDPACIMALYVAASLDHAYDDPKKWGVIIGSSRGLQTRLEEAYVGYSRSGQYLPSASPLTTSGSLPSQVARFLGIEGYSQFVSSTCTSFLSAAGLAAKLIHSGFLHGIVCGAVDSVGGSSLPEMLKAAGVTAQQESTWTSRPFGLSVSGMVLGEGAAIFVLETDKGQPAVGHIIGFGSNLEAGSLAGISKAGDGLAVAIGEALTDAGMQASDVDLIVAHGAGTALGDASELNAYRQVFGDDLPAITADKWLVGHTLGASAGIASALGIEQLMEGKIPALPFASRIQQGGQDKLFVGGSKPVRNMLVASLGFAGYNCAMIISVAAKNLS